MARSIAYQNLLKNFDCPACGHSGPFHWHLDDPQTREIECGNADCEKLFPVRNGVPIVSTDAASETSFNPDIAARIQARKAGA